MRWQNSLRAHGSVDWVIVVVESNDSKKKNKANILPRSSILDKIRSDFCNKQNDRYGQWVNKYIVQFYDIFIYLFMCIYHFPSFKFNNEYKKIKMYAFFNGRCVVLLDPLKESSRSQDSWNSMLLKLRTLLLMSFTKNLGRFEDDMRTLREKRTQPGWSFCEYFMVQVERHTVTELTHFTGEVLGGHCCKSNDGPI